MDVVSFSLSSKYTSSAFIRSSSVNGILVTAYCNDSWKKDLAPIKNVVPSFSLTSPLLMNLFNVVRVNCPTSILESENCNYTVFVQQQQYLISSRLPAGNHSRIVTLLELVPLPACFISNLSKCKLTF